MVGVTARLASRNEHKARELERLLPGWKLEPIEVSFPEEQGETFYDNAAAKARFGRAVTCDEGVLADDSGLEVEALSGEPGVHSARWAQGREAEKLLEELEGVEDRRARYVCELVLLSPGGDEHRGTGTLEGTIALQARGSEGFGFDPVFVPEGETKTVAELGNAWKAEHSHRAQAAQALLAAMPAPAPPPAGGRGRRASS